MDKKRSEIPCLRSLSWQDDKYLGRSVEPQKRFWTMKCTPIPASLEYIICLLLLFNIYCHRVWLFHSETHRGPLPSIFLPLFVFVVMLHVCAWFCICVAILLTCWLSTEEDGGNYKRKRKNCEAQAPRRGPSEQRAKELDMKTLEAASSFLLRDPLPFNFRTVYLTHCTCMYIVVAIVIDAEGERCALTFGTLAAAGAVSMT